MGSGKSRRARIKKIEASRYPEELIWVLPPYEELTGEALAAHRLAVLRVAKNPRGILLCRDPGQLRALLGPDDYATIPAHPTITIRRSYGLL